VLVHCAQGRSRSASIVTAYLMLTNRWDFEAAYSHGTFLVGWLPTRWCVSYPADMRRAVRTMRDVVRVNPGFHRQLLVLDAEIREEEEGLKK
jgi:hypothetical protein